MNQFITYPAIKPAEAFIAGNFPEIDQEINRIRIHVNGTGNADQCAIMISYFKDHKIRADLARSQPALVKILLSNTCRHIEDLFSASGENKTFRCAFEDYLRKRFTE